MGVPIPWGWKGSVKCVGSAEHKAHCWLIAVPCSRMGVPPGGCNQQEAKGPSLFLTLGNLVFRQVQGGGKWPRVKVTKAEDATHL